MKNNVKGCAILSLVSLIWGGAFLAQSAGTNGLDAFSFLFFRSLIAVIALYPVSLLLKNKQQNISGYRSGLTWIAGGLCGVFLFTASVLQQEGINRGVSSGKAAFITALYILFTPIIGLFFKKKTGWRTWFGVFCGVVGMFFLCMDDSLSPDWAELLLLFCAVMFACQIIAIDRFVDRVDCVKMSVIQFIVCTVLGGIWMIADGVPADTQVWGARESLLYLGIMSSAVAYTLQIVGQKYADTTPAALSMSLESVFAALLGWAIFNDKMETSEIGGCCLIFLAIIVSQLPDKKKSKC